MKLIASVIKWLWWLGLCYMPVALWNLEWRFMDSIGCPPSGDCYVPGSEILMDFDIWSLGWLFIFGRYALGFLAGVMYLAACVHLLITA